MWSKEYIYRITENVKKRPHVLSEIIKGFNKKDLIVAEIGVWDCYNAEPVLNNCSDVISQYWMVDFWKCSDHRSYKDIPTEKWDELYFYACSLMYKFIQTRVLRMDSIKASKLFPEKYFDLVFIDADHKYESVIKDIKAWMPLVKSGGLLTGHDYNRTHPGVVRAVTECFDDIMRAPDLIWIKEM